MLEANLCAQPLDVWQPTASLNMLHLRARLLSRIRQFFAERQVLEVETPLLSQATVTDKHLQSFQTDYHFSNPEQKQTLYLQTSPEFAMKRLLAAGSGAIYQLCKAFRNQGESGRTHNPEFTMLEWYRPGFNHHDLMDEMESLLKIIPDCPSAQRFSYAELFQHYLQIDPHQASIEQLKQTAHRFNLGTENLAALEKDDWLNLLMTHCIEPQLPKHPVFIYDFPASQAALARIRPGKPALAERFEVYVQGLELANGFHELSSASEQRQRFKSDLIQREKAGYPLPPIDERLLAALEQGLPDCAGVALGIDRLIMLATGKNAINEVLSFPIERA
ncbi:elongation factor P--(R)-beta-lysine ligase [Rickettsiella endosymbiont of Dermanyssus gallinae]|uniref:elongation factor P--(R)-beta-lysine ligase n=1 Tax=Rickettsiella endosymbiont of Dermanyssus gallinae TaxID=2856608 RepID=UPI001C532027|nr:elongation factor P--(R)-beta-lysine ligase [Rickettsiella endosymbiont of Dermanyssus gallinae]